MEIAFQALLGRAPLPHEVDAYAALEGSPKELGLRLMTSQEFRRRAQLGEFPAGATRWVCAEIRDELKLWVDLMDAGVSAGAIADNWEPAETNFILSILKKGGCFLDIGAHLGWFTVLAAHRVGPEGRVYAFEPRQKIFNYMRASVEANGFQERCVLRCAALSDKIGTTSMAAFSAEFNSGHAFMVMGERPEGASMVEDIPTLTLDGLEWDRKIDLLKIDVEGAEAIVLKGGRTLLQRDRPVIVSELFPRWLRNVSGVTADEFLKLLKESGYRLFELTPHGVGREIQTLSKAQLFSEEYFTNIVGLTEEHIAEYLLRPLDGRLTAQAGQVAQLEEEVTRLRREAEKLAAHAGRLVERNDMLAAQLAALRSSSIWRACMALARLASHVPVPLRRFLVRRAKLGWWGVTGQLPRRWSQYRQFRRDGGAVAASHATLPPQVENPDIELAHWADRRGPVALVVDHCWPEPDRDSGSVDAVNLVRHLLAMGFEVVYASAGDLVQAPRYREELVALGVTALPGTGAAFVRKYIEDNRDIFSLVILSRVSCGGALFELVRYNCPDAKIIFNTVDLHFLRESRAAQLSGRQDEAASAERTREREEWLVGQADLTIVVSETEREILAAAVPRAPVLHLPLARDIMPVTAPLQARNRVGFIGGFAHLPNLDAVRWFLAEIWPLVRQQRPDLIFSIAGSGLPDDTVRPEDGVEYVGAVDDLNGWFETLLTSVAPLRIGAGAKGKVASSLANGVPCVVSAVAAEGMGLTDGETALIAATPEAFAGRILALAADDALRQELSAGGLAFARARFSQQSNLLRLHEALIKLNVPVPKEMAP
jgi:FkbM family methyltransferase